MQKEKLYKNITAIPEELLHIESWEDTVCALQQKYRFDRSFIAEKICDAKQLWDVDWLRYQQRDPSRRRTIAAYYRSIRNGGAEHVVAMLCNIWAQMKDEETGEPCFQVLVITDEEENSISAPEYPLVSQVKHLYMPKYIIKANGDYRPRFRRWQEIITEYKVDAVISSEWFSVETLWDMLAVKGHPTHPAFYIHSHGFMALPMKLTDDMQMELIWRMCLCDGVVILSECDSVYVKAFCDHVRYIMNPINVSLTEKNDYNSHELIWCGRLAQEKQPEEVIWMMKYLVQQIPDAKLYMLGTGPQETQESLRSLISQLELTENIDLVGFTEQIDDYYKRASVFISTSEYEGMPLVFMEALAYGLPIVTYDMPWLTFIRENTGEITTVPQRSSDMMAEEVAHLLKNQDICAEQGQKAIRNAQRYLETNLGKEWKEFLDEIDVKDCSQNRNWKQKQEKTSEEILFYYMAYFHRKGIDTLREERKQLSRRISCLEWEKKNLEEKRRELLLHKNDLEKQIQELSVNIEKEGKRNKKNQEKLQFQKKEIKTLEKNNKKLTNKIEKILNSRTYKVGKILLYLPRKVKQLFSRKA